MRDRSALGKDDVLFLAFVGAEHGLGVGDAQAVGAAVLAGDAGTGLDGFGWRLSIADIEASGGFSVFAGYQRIITVLQGAGMHLQVDGEQSRALLPFDA